MSRTILSGANLLDGVHEARPGTTVVVADGTIESVSAAPPPPEPGDRVIDLGGRTLMPGMWLGHCHIEYGRRAPWNYTNIYIGTEYPAPVLMALAMKNCETLIDSGFTGFIGAGCSNDLDVSLKLAIAEDLMDGPRIMASGRNIGTTGHDNDSAKWWYEMGNLGAEVIVDGADEIRKAVRTAIKRGAEMIKIFPTSGHGYYGGGRGLTHDELVAAIEATHDREKTVRGHAAWRDHILESVEAGIDIIDHGDQIDEECIELMAERGTTWVPSLKFLQWTREQAKGKSQFAGMTPEEIERDWQNVCKMLPVAQEAGVNIVPGDDYGLPFPHRAGIYAEELSLYVNEVGIAPVDVLGWATRNAGRLTGQPVGLVEPGYLADLVVVDGDPSADITLLERPAETVLGVMVNGKFLRDRL